jgi:hypothetical protein
MTSRVVGRRRSPWPGRLLFWLACAAALVGLTYVHGPSRVRLIRYTERVVTGFSLVDPALVSDFFLLQATMCPWRYGFSCAPENQPANLRVVPGRRTIDSRNPASRAQARALIDAEFKSGEASWSTVAAAAPGAAIHTVRFLAGFGWGFWIALSVSIAVAAALVFSLFDVALASVVAAFIASAGVAWLLAFTMRTIAPAGWMAQFAAQVSIAGLALMRLKDLAMTSRVAERVERSRRKRQASRPSAAP